MSTKGPHADRQPATTSAATCRDARCYLVPGHRGPCRPQDDPDTFDSRRQQDHSRSQATQPYRATKAAQDAARRQTQTVHPWAIDIGQAEPSLYEQTPRGYIAPYRCQACRTAHPSQLEADLCCPANELTQDEATGLLLGAVIARLMGRS